jgi:recombination protein RecT
VTTAVAKTGDQPPTLAQLIERMKPEIGRALPKHLNPDRMARIATTVLRQTPALARTTPESFLGALLTASQLGLEPGPTGEAYFVPYGNTCTFIPGYRGLIKLARQSGQVADVYAEIVYETDEYKVTLGLNRDLVHVPGAEPRGKPVAVYAVAKFKDGTTTFVTMTAAEVEAIRKRSKASGNGPWVTDWAAMARKTAVRQLSKWLPLSAEFNTAVALDGTVRTDVGPLVDVQPEFVDGEVVSDQPAVEAAPEPDQEPEVRQSKSRAKPAGPVEVVMASKDQLAQLEAIRAREWGDDADSVEGWLAVVQSVSGTQVASVRELTEVQAQQVIDYFSDAAQPQPEAAQ